MQDKILLFIPMYNCEKQIVRVLSQLTEDVCRYIAETIVIDNRSTDGSVQAVREYLATHALPLRIRLLCNKENYGLGGSHKVAFSYAVRNRFDYLIVLHGDDQGNIVDILPYLQKRVYRKYDCFLGARFMKGAKRQGYSTFRTFGNIVYNLLFSAVCRYQIYDLGSGLNMYRVNCLRDAFYMKYRDDLVFNYCMILGASYYKHKVRFFPIVWREEDQVSNVKMIQQAVTVLKLLGAFFVDRRRFITKEHRDRRIENYVAQTVYCNAEWKEKADEPEKRG